MDRTSTNISRNLSERFKNKGAARLISDLMNPLFLPPAVMAVTGLLLGLSNITIIAVTVWSLLFHTLIPLGATLYLLKKKHISSLDLPDRQARNRLFIYTVVSAFVGFVGLALTAHLTHPLLAIIALVYLLNPILGYAFNLIWKMSIHTAALASAGAIVFSFSFLETVTASINTEILSLIILLLLLPLMIWARYRLKIHTPTELLGGALAGLLFTAAELFLLTNWW